MSQEDKEGGGEGGDDMEENEENRKIETEKRKRKSMLVSIWKSNQWGDKLTNSCVMRGTNEE